MNAPLLETKNLTKYFNTPGGLLHAVDHVNLAIYKGKTLGVVGESGCGKTTLGRTIVGLVEATDGEILLDGNNILKYPAKKKKELCRDVQMIFQDPYSSLNPRLTIGNIIEDPLKTMHLVTGKKELEERVLELMEQVGLPSRYYNIYPHELDGGRRQRVGLARALALNPRFIVCDEPVSALDVSVQAQILNLLMDMQEQQEISYMFITHNLMVVRHISDYIAVMYMGQVIEYAKKDELFANPLHPYTKALLEAVPKPELSVRNKKREIIKGEVTSPINPPKGCRFASRCKYVTAACTSQDISLKDMGEEHYCACALYQK